MEECEIFIERHFIERYFMERRPMEKDSGRYHFYTFGRYHVAPSFLYDILASSPSSMVK